MEGGGQVLFDAQFFGEGSAEVGGESGVAVADHFSGETEPFEDVVEVQAGDLWSGDGSSAGEEDGAA